MKSLWSQKLVPIREYKVRAVFVCEGLASLCIADNQDSKIYLADFTVRDVEHFLRSLEGVTIDDLPARARWIHSEGVDEFLASPREVYQTLLAWALEDPLFLSILSGNTEAPVDTNSGSLMKSIIPGKLAGLDKFDVFLS